MTKKQTKSNLQMKFDMIERLLMSGIDSKEKLEKLTPKDLTVYNMTFDDITLISNIRKGVITNSLFSFFAEDYSIPKIEDKPIEKAKNIKKKENSEVTDDGK